PTYSAQLDAKLLANAHAVGDVDGDDCTEFLFGSTAGEVIIFKVSSDTLVRWKRCVVDGAVSAICLDQLSSDSDTRIFVFTREGSCVVFHFSESGDEFRPAAEFRVPLNTCAAAVLQGNLVLGADDGTVSVWNPAPNALGGFRLGSKHELFGEIKEFAVTPSLGDTNGLLRIQCTHAVFTLTFESDADNADRPAAPLIKRVEYPSDIKNVALQAYTAIGQPIAHANTSGNVCVTSSTEDSKWSTQISDALVSLEAITIGGIAQVDAVLVCTWSGHVHAYLDPHNCVRFRTFLPLATTFIAEVNFTDEVEPEQVLVAISTSGVLLIYRDLRSVLGHAMNTSTDVNHASVVNTKINTEKKRKAILDRLKSLPAATDIAALSRKKTSLQEMQHLLAHWPGDASSPPST
ncbi:TPA: hypothetical protein N0F65_005512, partial [Lagenidium giganteum]